MPQVHHQFYSLSFGVYWIVEIHIFLEGMIAMTSHMQLSIIFSDHTPKTFFRAREETRWLRKKRKLREKRENKLEGREGPKRRLRHSRPRAVDLSVGPAAAATASSGSRIRQADSRAPSQTCQIRNSRSGSQKSLF